MTGFPLNAEVLITIISEIINFPGIFSQNLDLIELDMKYLHNEIYFLLIK